MLQVASLPMRSDWLHSLNESQEVLSDLVVVPSIGSCFFIIILLFTNVKHQKKTHLQHRRG